MIKLGKRMLISGFTVCSSLVLAFQVVLPVAGMEQMADPESEGTGIGWMEEYSDTEARYGTLALRADAFEGFHGKISIRIRRGMNGRTWETVLTGDNLYLDNLHIPVGDYVVTELSAVSEGREFDCSAEPEDIPISEDNVTVCKIQVEPGSVYRLPDEEAVSNTGEVQEPVWTDAGDSIGSGSSAGSTDAVETEAQTTAGSFMEDGMEYTGTESPGSRAGILGNLSPLLLVGLLGISGCAGSFFYVWRQNRRGR